MDFCLIVFELALLINVYSHVSNNHCIILLITSDDRFNSKTNFLIICADATSNKANSNTIRNLYTDFINDEEILKLKEEKDQLKLIEDYLKISNMNAYLVISLLFFFHSPTENFFLDSYCEPSRICHEEFVACYLTREQRTEYDQMISDNDGNLNQSLVDSLNLIIDHLMSNTNTIRHFASKEFL